MEGVDCREVAGVLVASELEPVADPLSDSRRKLYVYVLDSGHPAVDPRTEILAVVDLEEGLVESLSQGGHARVDLGGLGGRRTVLWRHGHQSQLSPIPYRPSPRRVAEQRCQPVEPSAPDRLSGVRDLGSLPVAAISASIRRVPGT